MKDKTTEQKRREALYIFLAARGDTWTRLIDIYCALRLHYPAWVMIGNFHNSNARRLISKDIQAINSDPNYPIIATGRYGAKLANEEEAARHIASEEHESVEKIKRVQILKNKQKLHGQFTSNGDVIKAFVQ